MEGESKKHGWVMPLLGGLLLGTVGTLLLQRSAQAAPQLNPGPAKVATVTLAPGVAQLAIAKGGSVVLQLPTGATWSTTTAPIPQLSTTGVQPTGSQSMNVVFAQDPGVLTANWVDASGAAQTTTIGVQVS